MCMCSFASAPPFEIRSVPVSPPRMKLSGIYGGLAILRVLGPLGAERFPADPKVSAGCPTRADADKTVVTLMQKPPFYPVLSVPHRPSVRQAFFRSNLRPLKIGHDRTIKDRANCLSFLFTTPNHPITPIAVYFLHHIGWLTGRAYFSLFIC